MPKYCQKWGVEGDAKIAPFERARETIGDASAAPAHSHTGGTPTHSHTQGMLRAYIFVHPSKPKLKNSPRPTAAKPNRFHFFAQPLVRLFVSPGHPSTTNAQTTTQSYATSSLRCSQCKKHAIDVLSLRNQYGTWATSTQTPRPHQTHNGGADRESKRSLVC